MSELWMIHMDVENVLSRLEKQVRCTLLAVGERRLVVPSKGHGVVVGEPETEECLSSRETPGIERRIRLDRRWDASRSCSCGWSVAPVHLLPFRGLAALEVRD